MFTPPPPKYCIMIVFDFSWDMLTQEKSKTMPMQNFFFFGGGGVKEVYYGIYESREYRSVRTILKQFHFCHVTPSHWCPDIHRHVQTIGTFRSEYEYEYDYEYEFSVLSTRIRFRGRHFSKCTCSERKIRTRSRTRTPI